MNNFIAGFILFGAFVCLADRIKEGSGWWGFINSTVGSFLLGAFFYIVLK